MKNRIVSIILSTIMILTAVPIISATEELASVEVNSWYQLRDAMQSDEVLEITVPEGIHIQHTYNRGIDDPADLQVSVVGKKVLNLLGDITFTDSVSLDKGLICLWNSDADLTVKGVGTFKYDLPFEITEEYISIAGGNLFYLTGGHLSIEEDVTLSIQCAWTEHSSGVDFIQAPIAGVHGTVEIKSGNIKGHTIFGEGVDWIITGGTFSCAGQYDSDIVMHSGTIYVSGGTFMGGIGGFESRMTFEPTSLCFSTEHNVFLGAGGAVPLDTPVVIINPKFEKMFPEPMEGTEIVNIGAFEEGSDYTMSFTTPSLHEAMVDYGLYGSASIKVKDSSGNICYETQSSTSGTSPAELSFVPGTLAPGTYIAFVDSRIMYNGISYSNYVYSYAFVITQKVEPISFVSATVTPPATGESPVFSVTLPDNAPYELATDLAENGIKWYWHSGAYVSGSHKYNNGHDYTAHIYLRPKEGFEFGDDMSVTVNGNSATISKVADSDAVVLNCTFTASSDVQLYFVGLTPEPMDDNSPRVLELIQGEELTFSFGTNILTDEQKSQGYSIERSFTLSKGLTDVCIQILNDTGEDTVSYTHKFTEEGTYLAMANIALLKDGVSVTSKMYTYGIKVTKPPFLPGDADSNGKVTLNDAAVILKYVAKWDVEIDLDAADVTGDGKVNLGDASLILKYVAKWDVEFK